MRGTGNAHDIVFYMLFQVFKRRQNVLEQGHRMLEGEGL
jgi:hypothetical protein